MEKRVKLMFVPTKDASVSCHPWDFKSKEFKRDYEYTKYPKIAKGE